MSAKQSFRHDRICRCARGAPRCREVTQRVRWSAAALLIFLSMVTSSVIIGGKLSAGASANVARPHCVERRRAWGADRNFIARQGSNAQRNGARSHAVSQAAYTTNAGRVAEVHTGQ
jgi:hypothetical protein